MGKRVVKIWEAPAAGSSAVLLILSAAFLLGGLAGCVLAGQVTGEGSDALRDYLEGYLAAVGAGGAARPEVWSLMWETVRWPLFALALSLTPLGLLGIPVLFVVRGFLLSFSIASFFRVLGAVGLGVAFVVFGITGLICVPIFFILGVQSFLSAGALAARLMGEGRRAPLFDRMAALRCGLCAAALGVSCLLEYWAVPVLLESLGASLAGI